MVVGTKTFMDLIGGIVGLASGNVSSSLTDALTSFVNSFSLYILGALIVSTFLNTSTSWWVMIYHTTSESSSDTGVQAYYRTCKDFFYAQWIVGILIPGAMTLHYILEKA